MQVAQGGGQDQCCRTSGGQGGPSVTRSAPLWQAIIGVL